MAAALLAFFLGTLGIHNFYLHRMGRAVTQLALTIVGWITAGIVVGFILVFAVAVWAFVEFILILVGSGSYATDGDGHPLR
ncbi:NINE protein [Raineyella sp.]|uniref:NINE protein n=1 Tax=Raineyella sp. TaxID=1911550 RepID=UPI002B1F2111|nr:NINE protein [Raineyella sp.]MEA5153198.1 NINE protein [Raineyella sp.]